ELNFKPLYMEVGAIEAEGGIAQVGGIEEQELHAVPLHLIAGEVHNQSVVQQRSLDPDLLVLQRVRTISEGFVELIDATGAGGNSARGPVEGTRTEALGEGVVCHDVRRDVPGDVGAALYTRIGLAVMRGIDVDHAAGAGAVGHIQAAR